jgi:CO/xanthine dehydrogenase Mo-binding subunit
VKRLPLEKIIINLTFLGGGFGRKAFMDYPHEAAGISREMGVPVQVVWSREDDMTQSPYRPGISYRCELARRITEKWLYLPGHYTCSKRKNNMVAKGNR